MTDRTDIERRLEVIDVKIDSLGISIGEIAIRIVEAIAITAVQKNQINNIDQKVEAAWKKVDTLQEQHAIYAVNAQDIKKLYEKIDTIQNNQASCPKIQVKYLWFIVVPIGLTLLGLMTKLVIGIP